MSAVPEVDNLPQLDVTDSLAEALPPNLQAAYYRELNHCRSLPENDEMLRIIRILQILTYLIHQAPAAVATEREKIGTLFGSLIEAVQRVTQSIGEYQNRVDQRLAELPEDLAKRIQPAAIAKELSENLHQEFARAGLLDLGQAFQTSFNRLEKLFARLDSLISGFETVVMKIEHEMHNAAREHLDAMRETRNVIVREGERMSQKYRWQRDVLIAIVLIVVFTLGVKYGQWLNSPVEPPTNTVAPAIEQSAPVTPPPKPRPKGH